jgi:hypothetical protein
LKSVAANPFLICFCQGFAVIGVLRQTPRITAALPRERHG